eukprot:1664825-Amphidinium_carterae.1
MATSEEAQQNDFDAWRREHAKRRKIVANGFHKRLPEQFIVQRRILRPQIVLLLKFLRMSTLAWEKEQLKSLATTGHRLYRPLQLLKGVDIEDFTNDMAKLLRESWGFLARPTLAVMSSIFRQVAKACAVAHKLLTQRHKNYPHKLFALLEDRSAEAATRILNESRCVLDT